MDGQLIAGFGAARGFVDVGEIQSWINALRIKVKSQRYDVDVAGTLAVAEQGAFDPLRARHHGQFRRRDRRAAIIVRVHAQDRRSRPATCRRNHSI